jgi:hypothetical protein
MYILDFPALQNPFTSLITFQPLEILDFLLISLLFTSSLITFLTLFLKVLGTEGKVRKPSIGSFVPELDGPIYKRMILFTKSSIVKFFEDFVTLTVP